MEESPLPWRRDGPPRYTAPAVIECFHCGKKGYVKRDCHVKLEEAKCSMVATTAPPEWTKTVQIKGEGDGSSPGYWVYQDSGTSEMSGRR